MTRLKLLTVGQLTDCTGAPPRLNAAILVTGNPIQAVPPVTMITLSWSRMRDGFSKHPC